MCQFHNGLHSLLLCRPCPRYLRLSSHQIGGMFSALHNHLWCPALQATQASARQIRRCLREVPRPPVSQVLFKVEDQCLTAFT